jgi:phage prohead protease, HK97 family
MTTNMERRFTELRVECRLRPEGDDKRTIGGYAAVFNKRSDDLGGFYEVVSSSAFNQARGKNFPGLVALYNHEGSNLLGTTDARTLRADTDEEGLLYEVDINDEDPMALGVYARVKRGDVSKSSFAFRVAGEEGDRWEMDDNGLVRRTLLNVQLFDVSPVNTPAYRDSSVGTRSAEVALRSLASQMSADPADVLDAARERELRRFFKRTDGAPAQREETSGAAALALVMSKAKG